MLNPTERSEVVAILNTVIVAASSGNIAKLAETSLANAKEGADYLLALTPEKSMELLSNPAEMKKGSTKLTKIKMINSAMADISRLLLTESEYKELFTKINNDTSSL